MRIQVWYDTLKREKLDANKDTKTKQCIFIGFSYVKRTDLETPPVKSFG